MQHALLIVNRHSRNRQAGSLKDAVQLLEAAAIEVCISESESESHLVSLIAGYQREDGIIIVAGGDGTLSSALPAVYRYQRRLAIFPMGTANDFARSIGVPENLLEAARIIIKGRRERISLGQVNNQLFINVAHLGLGVDVTHKLTSEGKKYLGVLAYMGAFIKAIKHNKSFKVHIEAEDWHCSTKAVHVAVGNGRFYGGGNVVAQGATLLNGQLNLFCIKAQPWWQLVLLGPSLRRGALHTSHRLVCKTSERFSIQTSKPRELEADGEFKTTTPAEFAVIPGAIEVIVGKIPTSTIEDDVTCQ